MFGGVTFISTATAWLCSSRLARCCLSLPMSGQRGFAKFAEEDAKIYERQLKRYKRRSAKEQLDRMLKKNIRGPEVRAMITMSIVLCTLHTTGHECH